MTTTLGTATIALIAAALILTWFAIADRSEGQHRIRRLARVRVHAGRQRRRLPRTASFPG